MDSLLLHVFRLQAGDQARMALNAHSQVAPALQSEDIDATWDALQTFVTATGNVAKVLWGQSGRRAEDRAMLRRFLKVEDDSPLRDVALRNHFEHLDERIDQWWAKDPRHIYLDRGVGDGVKLGNLSEYSRFREYNPETETVHFWGDEYPIPPLVDSLKRLLAEVPTKVEWWP